MKRTRNVDAGRTGIKRARKQTRKYTRKYRNMKSIALSIAETKMAIQDFNETVVSTNVMSTFDLNVIDVGAANQRRVGTQIVARGIHLKGFMHNNSKLEPIKVRMLIVRGKRSNNTPLIGTTELFTDGEDRYTHDTLGGKALYYPVDPSKWTVCLDRTYTLGASPDPDTLTITTNYAGHDGRGSMVQFNHWINCKNLKVNYLEDETNVPDVRWHLCLIPYQGDRDTILGSNFDFNVLGRFYYKDP